MMLTRGLIFRITISLVLVSGCAMNNSHAEPAQSEPVVELPEPRLIGSVSVEQALRSRRSVRRFKTQPLTLDEVSQLVWAAQGMTSGPYRTAPSAGALYPLEVYVAVGNVEGLDAGVYHYDPSAHALSVVRKGNVLKSVSRAAYSQDHAGSGAIAIVFSAVYERTTRKYGEKGIRFAHMEAGHAAQNVHLQAEALGLGTVVVGAFMSSRLKSVLGMRDDERPLIIMPVGKPMW